MQLPSNPLSYLTHLEQHASKILGHGYFGIDIGTTSLKMVQLSIREGGPTLDTYGEIDLSPYKSAEPGRPVTLDSHGYANAIQDLIHAVGVSSRAAGIAVPLSSALVTHLSLPKRDPEQMRRILPSEAKSYIPVPLESVTLDWIVVSEDQPHADAFKKADKGALEHTIRQDILLVAVQNDTLRMYDQTVAEASITPECYELESISAARATSTHDRVSTLLLDIGASSTKLCITNPDNRPVATHAIGIAGIAITEAIMRALDWPFEKAEAAKRTAGCLGSGTYSHDENAKIRHACEQVLESIVKDAMRVAKETAHAHAVDPSRVVLAGSSSLMPGIEKFVTKAGNIDATIADPFKDIRAPLMLSDALKRAGPTYTVALGLALRLTQGA